MSFSRRLHGNFCFIPNRRRQFLPPQICHRCHRFVMRRAAGARWAPSLFLYSQRQSSRRVLIQWEGGEEVGGGRRSATRQHFAFNSAVGSGKSDATPIQFQSIRTRNCQKFPEISGFFPGEKRDEMSEISQINSTEPKTRLSAQVKGDSIIISCNQENSAKKCGLSAAHFL